MGGCIAEKSAGLSKRISGRHSIRLAAKKVLLGNPKNVRLCRFKAMDKPLFQCEICFNIFGLSPYV